MSGTLEHFDKTSFPEIGDIVDLDDKTVKHLQFGLLSSETILRQSVGEITKTSSKPDKGTIYDPSMGAVYRTDICPTCKGNFQTCNGHFAHIKLAKPVINPKCEIAVKLVLLCICSHCSKVLFRESHIKLMNIRSNIRLIERLKQLNDLAKICKMCEHCGKYRIKYNIQDHRVYRVQGGDKIRISIDDIVKIFKNISDADAKLLGFNIKMIRPEDMIFEYLPVLPHCSRPTMQTDGSTNEDSISQVYIDIIKCNTEIERAQEKDKAHYIDLLSAHISTLFFGTDKNQNVSQRHAVVKGIAKRLGGKQGQFRSNCNGKRSNATGRSVISIDPSLALDEVGIPAIFAEDLWFPETVYDGIVKINGKITNYGNKEKLQDMINKTIKILDNINTDKCAYTHPEKTSFEDIDKTSFSDIQCDKPTVDGTPYCQKHRKFMSSNGILVHGIIVKGDDKTRELKYYRRPIKNGDVVLRRIQDGDWVLFNRQPTLHKMSMMAFKARLTKGNTIRMNPACCTAYNADFDGDEMNIFPAQNYDTEAELSQLASVFDCIVSPQNHRNIITVIQDTILGAGKMTITDTFWDINDKGENVETIRCSHLARHIFFDLLTLANPDESNYNLKSIVDGLIRHEWQTIALYINNNERDKYQKYQIHISAIDIQNLYVQYISNDEISESKTLKSTEYINILKNPKDIIERYEVVDDPNKHLDPFLSSLQTRAMRIYGKNWINTRVAISALFPPDYCYIFKNETDKNEPVLKIHNGIIVSGCLCKKVLGPVQNSIIQDLWHRYSPTVAGNFITRIQHVVQKYMQTEGFSVGIADCEIKNYDKVKTIISDAQVEVDSCIQNNHTTSKLQADRLEIKITGILNQVTGKGFKLVMESLPLKCRLLDMVRFGSKGSITNVTQISGCVGQQNSQGGRPRSSINNNMRILPHFAVGSTDLEARGFVKSSFRDGLSATEFFFHAMGGREGIADTAIKTSDTGYMQRRLIKATEDHKTHYDGTVRSSVNTVYSFLYGDVGLDPTRLVKCVDGKPFFCDINRIVDTLNDEYEQSLI